jgi:hypothetical protein
MRFQLRLSLLSFILELHHLGKTFSPVINLRRVILQKPISRQQLD